MVLDENKAKGALMWMQQRVMQRRPGREGVVLVLADVSTSIGQNEANLIKQACADVKPLHEGLRFCAWGDALIEVPWNRSAADGRSSYPDLYKDTSLWGRSIAKRAGGGNNLPKVLRSIEHLNPCKTIILSDGYEDGSDACRECLSIVDRMTGSVDAFCTSPNWLTLPEWDGWPGPSFMAELARRSGGRLVDARRCDLRVEVKRSIHVTHQTRVIHHHLPPLHHWV